MHESDMQALRQLEAYAHDLAAGRAPRIDIRPSLGSLRIGTPKGSWLLRILHSTIDQVEHSPSARRQFFHAARAFVSLRRDPLAA